MPTSFAKTTTQLEAHIKQAIDLNASDGKGSSQHRHLTSVIKQMKKDGQDTSELEAQLVPVAVPEGSAYMVDLFAKLSHTRSWGMSGPSAISYLEIKAYCELTGETLTAWEIETLRSMDMVFIHEHAIRTTKETQK